MKGRAAMVESAEDVFFRLYRPGEGRVLSLADADPSPDGAWVAYVACTLASLDVAPASRIHVAPSGGGDAIPVSSGPADRFPRWSPDGTSLTFVSSRGSGRDRVFILDLVDLGEARLLADVGGTVEWTAWSPDGTKVLLGVAGCGADRGGAFGSGTTATPGDTTLPAWLPEVHSAAAQHNDAWRRAWTVDVANGAARPASPDGLTIWEAAWAGDDTIVAVAGDAPDEGAWYAASLVVIALDGDSTAVGAVARVVLAGASDATGDQLALPAASASGRGLAAVRAVCSDRGLVAGDLVVSVDGGRTFSPVETAGVDVSAVAWLDETTIGILGVRGFDTVAGVVTISGPASSSFDERWCAFEAVGPRTGEARFTADGRAVGVVESWDRPPAVAVLGPRSATSVVATTSFDACAPGASVEQVSWRAPDGLEIEALLVRPHGPGPFPTLLYVHGGPVYCWRNRWMQAGPLIPALLARGVAVVLPNPRGSSGRGQAFARMVVGDMGGNDALDLLAGLDHLVDIGIADQDRLAVTGLSYGGFMSSWLITRTDRFAASMPMSPCTDWWSQHYASNIGAWDSWFMGGSPDDPAGRYGDRSPIVHADAVSTPCLFIAGALDKCTPPTQATELHRALRERGVASQLAIYPQEGHGVVATPARVDLLARQLEFLDQHLLGCH